MSTAKVQLSGIVYVKDPEDGKKIASLKAVILSLRHTIQILQRKAKPFSDLENLEQRLNRKQKKLERISLKLKARHKEIQRIQKRTVGSIVKNSKAFQHDYWNPIRFD